MQIFGSNKNDKPKATRNVSKNYGNYEDYQKSKAEQLPKIQAEIEKLFKNYDGGGVGIVINTYDENGDVDGHHVAILGVDKPSGLIKLAKGLHMASEECVETLTSTGDPEMLMQAALEMMKEITDIHKENRNDNKR